MGFARLQSAALLASAAAASLSFLAFADAPPPKPPERSSVAAVAGEKPPAPSPSPAPAADAGKKTAADKPQKPMQPSLQEVRALDLTLALEEARRLAGQKGAAREQKEQLVALFLLAGRNKEAAALLAELYPSKDTGESGGSLESVVTSLAAQVRAQPERKKGEGYTESESSLRLRLAVVQLACQQDKQAYETVSPLGACKGPAEVMRLALVAISAGAAGKPEEAVRASEQLSRRISGDSRLGLRASTLADNVVSYGVYTERPANKPCRPGDNLTAYCEVLNFACRPADATVLVGREAEAASGREYLTALDVDLVFIEEEANWPAERDRPSPSKVVLQTKNYAQVRHRTRSELRDLHLVIRFRVPRECVADANKVYSLKVVVRDPDTKQEAVSTPIHLPLENALR